MSNNAPIVAAVITAGGAITVGLIAATVSLTSARRDRRRELYSKATQAAVGWKELLYRVRRREADSERQIIEEFHRLQDSLTYYQAWVGSDSKYMKRSYDTLVSQVKKATEDEIRKAWSDPIRPVPGSARDGDVHPDLEPFIAAFLKDVRSHVSVWPWRKLAVRWRNRAKVRGPDA